MWFATFLPSKNYFTAKRDLAGSSFTSFIELGQLTPPWKPLWIMVLISTKPFWAWPPSFRGYHLLPLFETPSIPVHCHCSTSQGWKYLHDTQGGGVFSKELDLGGIKRNKFENYLSVCVGLWNQDWMRAPKGKHRQRSEQERLVMVHCNLNCNGNSQWS